MKSQNSSMGRAWEVRATVKILICSGVSSGIRSQTKLENNCTNFVLKGGSVRSADGLRGPPESTDGTLLHISKSRAI
eukprot:CAMPEP_0115168064 /NCGR_PEP_ID=MMETSP0270-20121206/552_1 /TAXON_ID=71861 /ORGANISM="Scrippsiella trochoidea, Strain CCMP3099" /LENGTH=76 /DNA_ID=CAMNT_0002580703 /DNA_START=549 /DNA_END=779 /DNA_ORIENTATION=+